MIDIKEIASAINEDCQLHKYYWAIGMIKETLHLWEMKEYSELLCPEAGVMVNHYLEERKAGHALPDKRKDG